MDYKKKYEKANTVIVKIQKMIGNNNLDAVDFCENINRLLKEYNKKNKQ